MTEESKIESTLLPLENEIPQDKESATYFRHSMKRMRSSVFFKDEDHGWLKGELIETDHENGEAIVIYTQPSSEEKQQEIRVKLEHYGPTQSLPLQCLDNQGSTLVVEDLRDLPYSNEATILYNLKERYEVYKMPYTRATNNVMVAINPYHWIDGLYSQNMRQKYARNLFSTSMVKLPPHIYEISSMALKGILCDDVDQTIVVSGESGSGKTVSFKLLMGHLATFHEQEIGYLGTSNYTQREGSDNDTIKGHPGDSNNKKRWHKVILSLMKRRNVSNKILDGIEQNDSREIRLSPSTEISNYGFVQKNPSQLGMEDSNIIVQRVIDSNPLLEAFGNAKTFLNDNSSRFSRYSKLQFHVENSVLNPIANIAGSTCHTFLLEKSRVVSHDSSNNERTFHIFYQLMAASNEEKDRIWKGLVGKDTSAFKYIGSGVGVDDYTNLNSWKNTISALDTIGEFFPPYDSKFWSFLSKKYLS